MSNTYQVRAMVPTLLRLPAVQLLTGYSRSTLYLRISQGLFVQAVSLGARAVAFPSDEVAALNKARIAGKSDADIRKLVDMLHAARTYAPMHEEALA